MDAAEAVCPISMTVIHSAAAVGRGMGDGTASVNEIATESVIVTVTANATEIVNGTGIEIVTGIAC